MVPMDWWVVSILGVLALGVVFFAFFLDRGNARKTSEILSRPPDREELATWTPTYLLEEDIRRSAPGNISELEDVHDDELSPDKRISGGWMSRDFLTHPRTGHAILSHPLVILIEQVSSFRLLIPILELVHRRQSPLVIVAHDIDTEVVTTLGLNALGGKLKCLCVHTDDLDLFAERLPCEVALMEDLMAGYLPEAVQGSCELWVSDSQSTWIL